MRGLPDTKFQGDYSDFVSINCLLLLACIYYAFLCFVLVCVKCIVLCVHVLLIIFSIFALKDWWLFYLNFVIVFM